MIGSVAFVNHARAAFIITEDPDDRSRRLFLPSKTNLGRPRDGLAYRIATHAFQGADYGSMIWAPYVQWEDAPVTISADQAMAALASGPEGRSAIEEAKQFLIEILGVGEVSAKDVKTAANAHIISASTLRRAKDAVGVEVRREGFGPGSKVFWSLSSLIDAQHAHRCSQQKMSTYAENEHLCSREADQRVAYEERAAIREYDGGLSRDETLAEPDLSSNGLAGDMPTLHKRIGDS